MKKSIILFYLLPFLLVTNQAQAQSKFAVTLQGGYGTGAYEATHTGIVLGKLAFRADVSYSFMPIVDAYVAYTRAGFACGEDAGSFCRGGRIDFTASGLNLGLRLNRTPGASEWIPWFRAGLVYQSLKWERLDQSYSDAGLGFEIGTGLAYPVTGQIKIVPSVNYTRFSVEGANGVTNAVVVISAMIGARYEF